MHRTYILTIQRNINRASKLLSWIPNSEILIGLDAKNDNDRSLIASARSETKTESLLSDGEAACTLGHKMILENFLKTNNSYCVVLEDDVEATPVSQYLERDLSEIFGGNNKAIIFILAGQEGLGNYKYIDWKCPFRELRGEVVYDLTASAAFVFGTCAYGINRYAARQLVDYYEKTLIVADDYLRIVNNTGAKILFKKQGYYSHPIGAPSEIESDRVGITRMRSSVIYRLFGIALIFIYNGVAAIKPSFYRWVLENILFEKD